MKQGSDKFISLQEATKFCGYSQEYLSLRTRQGKLKAVKFGRNWVTKKEWLDAYVANVENYKNNIKNNGKRAKKIVLPPSNLPVGDLELVPVRPTSSFGFRFGFALTMVLVLMVVAIGFWGRDSLKTVTNDVANVMLVAESKISEDEIYSAAVYEAADVFKNYFKWVEKSPAGKALGQGYLVVKEGYIKADKFLQEKYLVFGEAIFDGANRLAEGVSRAKEFVLNLLGPSKPEPAKEGLVVIPSTEKDEEIKEKIKESFSDEVKVEPADKTSGIITPVFRTGEGDKYLYILVPIKN